MNLVDKTKVHIFLHFVDSNLKQNRPVILIKFITIALKPITSPPSPLLPKPIPDRERMRGREEQNQENITT